MDLSRLPRGTPRIASGEVKWEKGSDVYKRVRSRVVEDLDEKLVERIQERAIAAYRALKLRDYGRIDLRLTPKGEAAIRTINPLLRRVNDRLFQNVSREEFAIVSRFLSKFALNSEYALAEIRHSDRERSARDRWSSIQDRD